MTLDEAKKAMVKFVELKTTLRPAFVDPILKAEEVKHGQWITVSDGYGNGVATARICECSLCKDTVWVYKDERRKWNYCPRCGAQMEVEDAN